MFYLQIMLLIVRVSDRGLSQRKISRTTGVPMGAISKVLRCHYGNVIMSAMASGITSLTIVYSTIYLGADKRKHQCSVSLAVVREIHRWPVNSHHKGPVTRKMFPFGDVIMVFNRPTELPGGHVGINRGWPHQTRPCRDRVMRGRGFSQRSESGWISSGELAVLSQSVYNRKMFLVTARYRSWTTARCCRLTVGQRKNFLWAPVRMTLEIIAAAATCGHAGTRGPFH